MAVKPVEYTHDSSTPNFAKTGEFRDINSANAVAIQKDVKQNFTKPLDKGQEACLAQVVNPDDVTYTSDEQKNVGKGKIDTNDANNKKGAGTAGAAAGGMIGAIGAGAACLAFCTVQKATTSKTEKTATASDGITQAALAAIMVASAAVAATCAFLFDTTLKDKTNKTNAAEDTNAVIQSQSDTLSSDIDNMAAESETYTGLIEEKTETDLDRIDEVTMLKSEMNVYQAQGDTEKAQELQKQIERITKGAEEDPIGEQLEETKGKMDEYDCHYNESLGVAEAGDTVAKFLQQGKPLKILAMTCGALLTVCSIYCFASIFKMWPKLAPLFPDLAGSTAAKVLAGVAGALFMVGAGKMFAVGKKEGAAGDAGDTMAEYVTNLNTNTEAQAGFKETTSAGYDAADGQYQTTTQNAQNEADKGLQEQQQQLAEIPTNTPEDTNKTSKKQPEPEPETNAA